VELSPQDKITVLLNRLDFHNGEFQRREHNEDKLFEWGTTILLAIFAVVIALADSDRTIPNVTAVKVIASFLVAILVLIFIWRILSERGSMFRQAMVVENITKELRLFEKGYYIDGKHLYPSKWHGSMPEATMKRKTPVVYGIILGVMLVSVIATIWLAL
jgi:hypothetical protein